MGIEELNIAVDYAYKPFTVLLLQKRIETHLSVDRQNKFYLEKVRNSSKFKGNTVRLYNV